MGPRHCTRCNAELEEGQIGLCDECQDNGRTRIGNTPTCETCGQAECICDETDDWGNEQRAAAAHRTVEYFADLCGEIGVGKSLLEQNMTDLLCDLAHLCDREELSLTSILASAEMHYDAETENTGMQFDTGTPAIDPNDPFNLTKSGIC
jgi:hypothetical protein